MSKKALITGICGQDAAYMAKLLLEKGYTVYGTGRTLVDYKLWRLQELGVLNDVVLISGDITDGGFVYQTLKKFQPDECYNFAAISFVGQSWEIPALTCTINIDGVLNILKAIRDCSPHTRLYQAGSSEMFGRPVSQIQNEREPFAPCNPYGISKLAAYHLVSVFRSAFNIFACNGICYNHESPLRGTEYVTRKITDGVAKIKHGLAKEIRLGNVDAIRDWGFAGDFVKAMWLMLQQEQPDDYVIATGKTRSIRDFLTHAFAMAEIQDWEKYIVIDEQFYRPLEPHVLCGDASKAHGKLGWKPEVPFEDIVRQMVYRDLERVRPR